MTGRTTVLEPRTVCITGVGAATPLGHTFDAIADALLAGRSGVGPITSFPIDDQPSQIAGSMAAVPCPAGWDEEDFARQDRLDQLALYCCWSALRDAGWWERRSEARVGLVFGTATEWFGSWERDLRRGGQALFQPQMQEPPLVERARRRLELTGPAVSLSAACASGNHALAMARRWLDLGWVDVCLAGAADMSVSPLVLAGFGNLKALSRRNHDPAGASRPFDAERDGFVVSEGGTMFVLERAERARKRSARVYARLAGCGATSDAHHMVIPSPDPGPAIAAMRHALTDAGINAAEVDYVNAHATSTPVGDMAEGKVLEAVFGDAVRRVPVSSTKSMTGHLLAAAAAVEALACLAALERQAIPPTINLHQPDANCNLCHVAHQAWEHRVKVAVSNSFGFGGSNTCAVFAAA